jgi:hypothetical protein
VERENNVDLLSLDENRYAIKIPLNGYSRRVCGDEEDWECFGKLELSFDEKLLGRSLRGSSLSRH